MDKKMSAAMIVGDTQEEVKKNKRVRNKKKNVRALLDLTEYDLIEMLKNFVNEIYQERMKLEMSRNEVVSQVNPIRTKLQTFILDLTQDDWADRLKKRLNNDWHIRSEIMSVKALVLEKWIEEKVEVLPPPQTEVKENE